MRGAPAVAKYDALGATPAPPPSSEVLARLAAAEVALAGLTVELAAIRQLVGV